MSPYAALEELMGRPEARNLLTIFAALVDGGLCRASTLETTRLVA